jgi:GNAT superfamily N-acetyltransferase
MRIVQWTAGDAAATKACYQVSRAVARHDDPLGPPRSERVFHAVLTPTSEPAQTWFAAGGEPGTATGFYHMRLPELENRDRAGLSLEVQPEHRRRGIGRALLRHAAQRAAENQRSVLRMEVFQGSAGEAFARHLGASPGLTDARRVLVLAKQPAGHAAALRESAAPAAAGYTLVSWTGYTPREYLDGIAAVSNAMSDAPHDPGHQSRVWDAERIREQLDRERELFGSRGYFIAALHEATGEMAALTEVELDPENPGWGHQQITAVTRPHRGHRLGLLTKAAMLDWLADAEPQLERIVTWNAASNQHMVGINEALGYELLEPQSQAYMLQVADVLLSGTPGRL